MVGCWRELWTRNQEAWLPGLAVPQPCGFGRVDTPLWASCFSCFICVNQLLGYPHRISARPKKENTREETLEMMMQCKDVKDDGCCTELDPNRQQWWVPALVINGGMKDFTHFLLPHQGSLPGKYLCPGKTEHSLGLLPAP